MQSTRFWASYSNPYLLAACWFTVALIAISPLIWGGPLNIGSLMQPIAIGVPTVIGAFYSSRKPIIEITDSAIRVRPVGSSQFQEIALSDIAGVEWPGHDNIGIRLRSGQVVSISVMPIPRSQWERALQAMRVAIEQKRE